MDSGEFQCVPRVQLTDLRSQSHPTEDWEMASEKLTLSMCRYNVCVLELPIDVDLKVEQCFVGLESLLQLSMPGQDVSDYTALKATGDEEPGLVTLPGRHSFNYKLGSSRCDKLPAQQSKQLQTAYGSLDNIARLALAAICRSCHVRLRSDTFAGILDDSPMPRGILSSSTLHAMQHINNFLMRDQLGDKWTMSISEEGIRSKGFMTVIAAKDTRRNSVPHVCKMQVKDALGAWTDVHLATNEVAVIFGQTATQASAGLFRPATYRVVGELYASCHAEKAHAGRQSLEFHLNARPSALINFHDILEEAGHFVPDRYTQPVCMKDLLQRFDSMLTPQSTVKSATPRSIQLGTIDAAAVKKRKRQPTPATSPVTRSGRVRRSTAGLVGDAAQKKTSEQEAKAGEFAAMVQAMRVYVTIDGSSECPTDFLPVGICHYQSMNTTWFRAHPAAPCCRIFESYCESMGAQLSHVRFLRADGVRVQGSELLMDLKLQEDERLVMLPLNSVNAASSDHADD